ncbi:MAG: class I tRNA ligase family protein, partial [Methanomethylovorans sp.]|nr:class I tRNA ligase family protein [Methanomethylovorans sp.]
QDVRWWVEHKLPLRKAIDKNGRMTKIAGKYADMTITECKEAVIADLKAEGYLYEQKELEQNVGMCWRCDTPIEILSEKQWFVKIDTNDVKKAADEINWTPEHMKVRLENWLGTMEWDWCISRQRIFATPIPVWYCKECGEVMVAKEEWMPIDPTQDSPKDPCSKCGSTDFEPEEDVLDTWMDSSITVQHVTGWLTDHKSRLPAQLRPQGHDIIRTWAFYTILRSMALAGKRPWDSILVNGMVLGEDGHKMSKSLGNIISPETVIENYSADSFRQWAAIGGAPGSDVMFRWKDVVAASRFFSKMWSIYRFSVSHFNDLDTSYVTTKEELHIVDRWLFDKLYDLITSVTLNMDACQFDEAFKAIRGFAWEVVADNYIELVKSRLYGTNATDRKAAQHTLYVTIEVLAKLLAPFAPFFAEEMYSRIGKGSVHMQSWPKANASWKDEEADKAGELVKEIVSSVRRYKSEHGIALNAPLKKLEIYGALTDVIDITGATNTPVEVMTGNPDFEHVPVNVKPNMGVIGPKFKGQAKAIIDALTEANPKKLVSEMEQNGKISLQTSSGIVELAPESVEIEKEVISAGRAVDVLDVKGIPVVVIR